MKLKISAVVLVGIFATTTSGWAQNVGNSCTDKNLNIDLALTQSETFRGFENRDLVKNILNLRKEAQHDKMAGNLESCGIKASVLQQMMNDPLYARTVFNTYKQSLNKQAADTGEPIPFPTTGYLLSNQQVIGAPLVSFNNMRLGTVSGIGYDSTTGQPTFIIVDINSKKYANQQVMVPTGMLLISKKHKAIFVNSTEDEFWSRVKFREVAFRNNS